MKLLKGIGTGLCLTLLCLLVTAKTKAAEPDSQTVVTLSAPLAVPGLGAQTLPAGTYIFKALNSSSDRDVIQISSQDGSHVFATILGVPNSRLKASDASVTMYDARPAGEPQALKAWFYPGRASGDQIVYEKPMATQLAKETNAAVLSTSADLATSPAETLKTAQIEAVSPSGETVAVSQVVDAPAAVAPAMAATSTTDTNVAATPAASADTTNSATPAAPADTTVAATPAASVDANNAATPAAPADTTVAATPAASADTNNAATPAAPADTTVAATPAASADADDAATPAAPADTTVAATPAASADADDAKPSATGAATPSAMPMDTTDTAASSTPTESAEPARPVAQTASADTLPKTASPLPLIGLGGLLLLGLGFLMSGFLKREA